MTTATAPAPLGESLNGASFSRLHLRFWLLAALGIMLDGFDFFVIGVASPLLEEDICCSASPAAACSPSR
jgi:hypothetical protein